MQPEYAKESLENKAFLLAVDVIKDASKIAANLRVCFQQHVNQDFVRQSPSSFAFVIMENQLMGLVSLLYALQQKEVIPLNFDIENFCYVFDEASSEELGYDKFLNRNLPNETAERIQKTVSLITNDYHGSREEKNNRQRVSNNRLEAWLRQQNNQSVLFDNTRISVCLIHFIKHYKELLSSKVVSVLIPADFQGLYQRLLSEDFIHRKKALVQQYQQRFDKHAGAPLMSSHYGQSLLQEIEKCTEEELGLLHNGLIKDAFEIFNHISAAVPAPTMVFDGSLFFSQQGLPEEIAFPHFPNYFKGFNEKSYLRTVMRAFAIVSNRQTIFRIVEAQ